MKGSTVQIAAVERVNCIFEGWAPNGRIPYTIGTCLGECLKTTGTSSKSSSQ